MPDLHIPPATRAQMERDRIDERLVRETHRTGSRVKTKSGLSIVTKRYDHYGYELQVFTRPDSHVRSREVALKADTAKIPKFPRKRFQ